MERRCYQCSKRCWQAAIHLPAQLTHPPACPAHPSTCLPSSPIHLPAQLTHPPTCPAHPSTCLPSSPTAFSLVRCFLTFSPRAMFSCTVSRSAICSMSTPMRSCRVAQARGTFEMLRLTLLAPLHTYIQSYNDLLRSEWLSHSPMTIWYTLARGFKRNPDVLATTYTAAFISE